MSLSPFELCQPLTVVTLVVSLSLSSFIGSGRKYDAFKHRHVTLEEVNKNGKKIENTISNDSDNDNGNGNLNGNNKNKNNNCKHMLSKEFRVKRYSHHCRKVKVSKVTVTKNVGFQRQKETNIGINKLTNFDTKVTLNFPPKKN